jgi:predicted nucleotidyltransferase
MEAVSAEMRRRIEVELDRLAAENGVQILLAIESGSRAWGFPSPDSDYDVRFIYMRPAAEYRSVFDRRDVIERPLDAVLDINGWDLRKALRLMAGSNAVVQEWLTSPVGYRQDDAAVAVMRELAQRVAHLPAFAYHYDRLARRSLDEILSGDTARLKAYCYGLRACLALAWIREQRSAPPMDLPRLLAGTAVSAALETVIADLVAAKAKATERDVVPRIAALDALFAGVLAEPVIRPELEIRVDAQVAVDQVFAALAFDAEA